MFHKLILALVPGLLLAQYTPPSGSGGGGGINTITVTGPIGGGGTTSSVNINCTTCITSAGTLTSNALIIGGGSKAVTALGSLGTTTTVLHGNAGGAPTFGAVTASDVSGTTGSGNFVLATSPTLVTPNIGAATATTINGMTITSNSGTFAVGNAKSAVISNTLTFTGTDGSSVNFGAGGTVLYSIAGGTCTNQVVTAISTAGAPTCTTITSAYVNNSIALTGTDINTLNQVTVTHLSSPLPYAQGGCNSGTTWTQGSVLFAGTGSCTQDASFTFTPTTTPLPTGGLLIGQGAQQFMLAGRGADSGASQGVAYFTSNTANTPTAQDLFPHGNPASTNSGSAWFDVCSNDLQPLNSDAWNCGTLGAGGYVFAINNGSLVQVVVSSNVATATTLNAHQLTSTTPITVTGGPSGLAGSYTVASTPSSTTFTFATSGVSNGTYTTAGMIITGIGSIYMGLHNSSAGLSASNVYFGGTSYTFQNRTGPGATSIYATLTASALILGATPSIKWYFNSGTQRMASSFITRWSSTSDPEGTADIGFGRNAAGVLEITNGTAGSLRDIKVRDVFTNDSSFLIQTGTTLTAGSTANVPTLTSGPVTGNPTKWIAINDNGTTRYIPAW